jgi:hypothetical protein
MLFHIPLTKASLMVKPNFSGKGKYTPPQEMVGRGVKIEWKALIDQGLANFFCKGSV